MRSGIAPKSVIFLALFLFAISLIAQPIAARNIEAKAAPKGEKGHKTLKPKHRLPWDVRGLMPCLPNVPSCKTTYHIPESPLAESDSAVQGVHPHYAKLP